MEKIYDMIVIGGGPAGLSAGIYGGRAKLDVLIILSRKTQIIFDNFIDIFSNIK